MNYGQDFSCFKLVLTKIIYLKSLIMLGWPSLVKGAGLLNLCGASCTGVQIPLPALMTITATLCYVIKDGKILLIMKKKGLGKGKWNGPGGKVEMFRSENIQDAAIRETLEEICIVPDNPKKVGELEFYLDGKNEVDWNVHVFTANEYNGIEKETKEAIPKWFPLNKIPYDGMWPDDKIWIPLMLKGKQFKGKFYFDKDAKNITSHTIEVIK